MGFVQVVVEFADGYLPAPPPAVGRSAVALVPSSARTLDGFVHPAVQVVGYASDVVVLTDTQVAYVPPDAYAPSGFVHPVVALMVGYFVPADVSTMSPPLLDPGGLHINDSMPPFGNIDSGIVWVSQTPGLSVVWDVRISTADFMLGASSGNLGDPPGNTKHFTPGETAAVPRLQTVTLRWPALGTHVVGAVMSAPTHELLSVLPNGMQPGVPAEVVLHFWSNWQASRHDFVEHGVTHRSLRLPFVLNAGGALEPARLPPVLLVTEIVGVLVIPESGTSGNARQYGSQGLSLQSIELLASESTPSPPSLGEGAGTV